MKNDKLLQENETPSSCRRKPFQYQQRKSIRLAETAVPVLNLYYWRTKTIQFSETAVRVPKLHRHGKIHRRAGNGQRPFQFGGDGRSSTKLALPEHENLSGCRMVVYYQRTKFSAGWRRWPFRGRSRRSLKGEEEELKGRRIWDAGVRGEILEINSSSSAF